MTKKDVVMRGTKQVFALNVGVAIIVIACIVALQLTGASGVPWVRIIVILGIMAVLFLVLFIRSLRCPDCKRSVALSVRGREFPDTCPYCGSDWTQEAQ